jgi:hypothetical protein
MWLRRMGLGAGGIRFVVSTLDTLGTVSWEGPRKRMAMIREYVSVIKNVDF